MLSFWGCAPGISEAEGKLSSSSSTTTSADFGVLRPFRVVFFGVFTGVDLVEDGVIEPCPFLGVD